MLFCWTSPWDMLIRSVWCIKHVHYSTEWRSPLESRHPERLTIKQYNAHVIIFIQWLVDAQVTKPGFGWRSFPGELCTRKCAGLRVGKSSGNLKLLGTADQQLAPQVSLEPKSKFLTSPSYIREFHEPGIWYSSAQFWCGFVVSANLRNTCGSFYRGNTPHLLEVISETATVVELRQQPLYTTPSGWWCIDSLFWNMQYPLPSMPAIHPNELSRENVGSVAKYNTNMQDMTKCGNTCTLQTDM